GMEELTLCTGERLQGREVPARVFQHSLAFNLIPHIDQFQENGYTREEMKVAWEMRKILGDETMAISCTAVRVPILRAHSESIVVETVEPADPDEVRSLFNAHAGIEVRDNPEQNLYPMPLTATGKYAVEVGRIRRSSVFGQFGIDFFVCGDQLLKGAALNAVQIAEHLDSSNCLKKESTS
ncbi:MAG: Asd/ArgC dimerization domain-containing protein, partial [Candidatus Wallbacteria bacterium]|nr:Asd/ArgC dimerization domain-containing protein [Candidatus Wallbacteria bacterium]